MSRFTNDELLKNTVKIYSEKTAQDKTVSANQLITEKARKLYYHNNLTLKQVVEALGLNPFRLLNDLFEPEIADEITRSPHSYPDFLECLRFYEEGKRNGSLRSGGRKAETNWGGSK